MSKQIQVNLAFNADTAKAKQQINDLVNSLNKIATKDSQIFDDRQLREAATAAKDLTKHLEAAVNVNTGKLDLNKFSQSLSHSKQNLQDLYNSLSKAGPQGQQAFLQLASSIASSDSQVLNLNSKVKDLGQTLKNTVKWQLSSSLVHGFMGALQHAIGYAKDLNSSLNDIRIVTGASAEQMAKFAEQANKSAKALSSTTTEYTKASLIYYQQGLSDEEVKARTDITIKMANVSKESAQVVSDQMTAVWNNFYDGSKSLEYYADVMTALGAATASSVDEIAGGLEKFAAIGDTIGLSYEYAASALATITSNTRQSEEVVGTALKTIFARIQGLNLGETLDDGTTLNKYSQALEKVGISIFDQAGELKAMDNILDELGDKWQTLSKDQQTALAQTVAGTRQYTQLVALLDNWNKGDSDSFKSNLQTIASSEGALQEQQDIYAESWEAAADRVKAATEDIYDSLINDEAIVVLLNGLEKVLDFTGALIDGFGGLKGILLLVAGIFGRQIANEIPEAIGKLKNNFDILTGSAQKKKVADIDKSKEIIKTNLDTGKVYKTEGDRIRAQSTLEELSALSQLEKVRSQLTDAQQKNIDKKIAERKASQQLIASIQDEIDAAEKAFKQSKRKIQSKQNKQTVQQKIESYGGNEEEWKKRQENTQKLKNKKQRQLSQNDLDYIKETEKFEQKRKELQDSVTEVGLKVDQTVAQALDEQITKLQQLYKQQAQLNQLAEDFDGQLSQWNADGKNLKLIEDTGKQQQAFKEIQQSMKNYAKQLQEIDNLKISPKALEEFNKKIDNIGENVNSVEDMEKAIQNMIQEFNKIESTDDNFKNLKSQIENISSSIQILENDIEGVEEALKALDPSLFKELQQAAEQAGTSVGELYYTLSKQKNAQDLLPKIDTSIPEMEFSTALTKVGAMGMDIMALFTELGSAITICFDEGATAGEKFVAVLSTIPAAAMTIADIVGGLADMPKALEVLQKGFGKFPNLIGGFFASISSKTVAATAGIKGLGTAFAGLSTTLGPVGAGIAIVIAALVALFGLFKLGQKIYNDWAANDPGKQFEAAQKATEGMTQAANDANAAYQNLLSTISGYDSAVSALEGLEVGTQEFTNALINANEKAWELIDAYNLIQGQDWEYGKNGEIIIKVSAKERITEEENNRRENAIVAASAARVTEKEKEYNAAKNDLFNTYSDEELNSLYKALGFSTGTSGDIKSQWDKASENGDSAAKEDIINNLGKQIYGEDSWKGFLQESDRAFTISSALERDFDSIGKLFSMSQDLDTAINNETQKMISTTMSDEEAYQQSSWKNLINEELESKYNDEKAIQDKTFKGETEDEIKEDFAKYLSDQNYMQDETGKVFKKNADGTKGDEVVSLSNLTTDSQRGILATVEAMKTVEAEGVKLAEGFNQVAGDMTETETEYANAIINNDISSLTKEQIEELQKIEDIKPEDLFDNATLEAIKNDPVLGEAFTEQFNTFKQNIQNWEPPALDLESWKNQFNAIKDLNIGDEIDPDVYNQLSDNMKKFFTETTEGTYVLTAAADDLTNKLKQDLSDEIIQQRWQRAGMESAAGNIGVDNITDTAGAYYQGGGEYGASSLAYTQLDFIKASGAEESANALKDALSTALEGGNLTEINSVLKQIAEAAGQAKNEYDALGESLNEKEVTIASTASSFDELNDMLNQGTIDIETYNSLLDSTIIKESQMNDLDYEGILEQAKYLSENADALENVDDALKDNLKDSKKVATSIAKLNKAVEKISNNWEDWNKAISSGDMKKINKYLPDINEALKDMLDLTDDTFDSLSDDFAIKNWKLIEDVVNGVEGAIEKLGVAASEDMILQIKPELEGTEAFNQMSNLLADLSNQAVGANLTIEPNVDNANALDSFVQLCESAGMTASEIGKILQGIGWEPKIDYEELDVEGYSDQSSFGFQEVAVLNPDGSFRTETVDLAGAQALSQEGKVYVPKIVSATKTGGGSGSYTPQKTNKKSGGGGGGQKKHPEKKSSSDRTRYHTLTNQLEDLTEAYDKIAEASDRAFGKEKIKAIDDEIAATDDLINKQKEYVDAISDHLHGNKEKGIVSDKDIMSSYFDKHFDGPAMEFDEFGNITNYDDIEEIMHAKYNEMAKALTEDSEDWQAFEKRYQQMEKYIEQYEETQDLLREETAAYKDYLNQKIDLQLEKVQYQIEVDLEIPENAMAILEFELGRIEDQAFSAGKALGLLTFKANSLYEQIEINKNGIEDIIQLSAGANNIAAIMAGNISNLTLTEDQADALKEYRDNLISLNEELLEVRSSIEEQVMNTFEDWTEELDKGTSALEHYGSVLESYKNIIDIVGKDVLGISDEMMEGFSQTSTDVAINQIEGAKSRLDAIEAARQEAKKALDSATDESSIRMWKETLDNLNEEAQAAQEELLSSWESALSAIADAFEASVERAVDAFNKSVYSLGGLEGLSEDFSRQKENSDIMLDDYQKIYELSKLSRDINKSIDDTELIGGKQKLKKLLNEINELQEEGTEISQYDLEYLQKTYDLRLAELELEEAQRAKNTVRLSKDNEGRWSYIYTQNTDAVDAAQQKYEDALYAMQDLSSNYIDEMSEQLIATSQEMAEALAAIRVQDYANINDYYAEVERVQKLYQEKLAMQEVELQKAINNNKGLYEQDWTNYSNATGYKLSAAKDFAMTFKDTLLGTLLGSEEDTANFTSIINTSVEALTAGLFKAAEEFYTSTNEAMNAAGTSTKDFAEDATDTFEKVGTESERTAKKVEDTAERMKTAFEDITKNVTAWQKEYSGQMDAAINKNVAFVESINQILAALSTDNTKITVSYDVSATTGEQKDAKVVTEDGTTKEAASYDTGGYTGSWGKSGKFLLAHEKELILNPEDTVNVLNAIQITRAMLETIDLNAKQASFGLGSLIPSTIKDDNTQTLEQQVHIVAEFPNVNDHNEIEQAFSNLINTASQYANRK